MRKILVPTLSFALCLSLSSLAMGAPPAPGASLSDPGSVVSRGIRAVPPQGLLLTLWGRLGLFWAGGPVATPSCKSVSDLASDVGSDVGSGMDPDGIRLKMGGAAALTGPGDVGSGMDPDGIRRVAPGRRSSAASRKPGSSGHGPGV